MTTCLVLSLLSLSAARAQSTSISTAFINAVLVDVDGSGSPTCGDGLDFTVTVAASPTANALNTELVLPIDARTFLDPTTVVVTSPLGSPQVVRADSVLDVLFGTVCGPQPCAPATVRFRTYIAFPAIGPDVFEQGTVSASNAATVSTNQFFHPFVSCGGSSVPDLALTKSDNGLTVDPGQTLPYTLTVRNVGTALAATVDLTETVPLATTFNAAASSPGWSCSGAAAGSTCSFPLGNLVPGAAVTKIFAVSTDLPFPPSRSNVVNIATVTTATQEPNTANNQASVTTPVRPGLPDLRLVKSLSGGAALPGATILYTLALSNLGNAVARSTSLAETVPAHTTFQPAASTAGWACTPNNNAGSSCSFASGDLGPGQSTSAVFAVRLVNPLPAGVTSVANTACAATTTAGDPAANNCSTLTTPAQGTPALSLSKSLVSGDGTPGSTLVFNLLAANSGNQDVEDVVLTETVPANTTFAAAASSPGWSCSAPSAGSSCSLALGALAGGGGSASRSFAVAIDNPLPAGIGSVRNTACAAADSLQSCDTATVPTNGAPALSLSKTLQAGTGAPGSLLFYALTVTNSGNQAAAKLKLTEIVPAHTTFEPASSTRGWTCTPDDNAASSCVLAIPTLAGGGASATYVFAVRIADPLPAGVREIANTACLLNGAATAGCDGIVTPTTGSPVLTTTKTLTGGTAAPGNTLIYTLTVTNSGNQDAAGVSFSDQLPPGTAWVSVLSSPGWICSPTDLAPSTCTLSIGPLAAGASASRTIALALQNPWPAGGTLLTNTGCAQDDTGKVSCSSIDTPVEASPRLSLLKTYSGPPLRAGAHLAFDLALSNTGNQIATGVTLQETVATGASFDAAASSPDWMCAAPAAASPCTLTIPSLAPGTTVHLTFALVAAKPLPPGVTQILNTACARWAPSFPQQAQGTDTVCSDASTPLPVFLSATLSDDLVLDLDHDSYPGTGDVLLYTLIVRNPSSGTAHDLRISVPALDPRLKLLPESIVTSEGTVTVPGTPADPIVTLPALAAGAAVTLTFRAQVIGSLPPGLRFLSTQGLISGADVSVLKTDDPDTPQTDDPTLTPLRSTTPAIHDIPTVSGFGLLIFAFALAGVMLIVSRRRGFLSGVAAR